LKNKYLLFFVILVSVAFLIWGGIFIYKSSFVIEGKRYFSLFDDAMISMRYGWNAAHANGFTWNPGERVEGYTNFLMVLLMAGFSLIFSKSVAVLAIQISGLVLTLLNAFLILQISNLVFPEGDFSSLRKALFFAAGLFYYPLLFWNLMGMETSLIAVLVSTAVLFSLKYQGQEKIQHLLVISISLGLATLARPDCLIAALIIFSYLLIIKHGSTRGKVVPFILLFVIYLLFPLGQSVFRWLYYGELLPNTYILKLTGVPLDIRLVGGLRYTFMFLKSISPLLLLVLVNLFFDFKKEAALLSSLFFAYVGYEIWVGGDPWVYWRILAPFLPFILVCAIYEIAEFSKVLIAFSNSKPFKQYLTRRRMLPGLHFSFRPDINFLKLFRIFAPVAGAIGIVFGLSAGYLGYGDRTIGLKQIALVFLATVVFALAALSPSVYQKRLARLTSQPTTFWLTIILFLSTTIFINGAFLKEVFFFEPPYTTMSNKNHTQVAIALEQITTPDATIGVFWAGTLPYYVDRTAIDFLGKNDKYIAGLQPDLSGAVGWFGMVSVPGHNKYDLEYSIETLLPTYIQGTLWGQDDVSEWANTHYTTIKYSGQYIQLLRNSSAVLWDQTENQ
jgi:hypothetical protein